MKSNMLIYIYLTIFILFSYIKVVWSTNTTPANNEGNEDGAKKPIFSGGLYNADGSVLRIVDFPPNTQSPMHRTKSIDYGIVIWGEIELELDSGEKTILKQSQICVQRGSNHLWRNATDKWTRIAYVLLEAEKMTIEGKTLDDSGFSEKHD